MKNSINGVSVYTYSEKSYLLVGENTRKVKDQLLKCCLYGRHWKHPEEEGRIAGFIASKKNFEKVESILKSIGSEQLSDTTPFRAFWKKHEKALAETLLRVYGNVSTVTVSGLGTSKNYAFVGGGCYITYLKLVSRKSKKREEIMQNIRAEFNSLLDEFAENFTKQYSHKIPKEILDDCPVRAVIGQDRTINGRTHFVMAKYINENFPFEVEVHSVID